MRSRALLAFALTWAHVIALGFTGCERGAQIKGSAKETETRELSLEVVVPALHAAEEKRGDLQQQIVRLRHAVDALDVSGNRSAATKERLKGEAAEKFVELQTLYKRQDELTELIRAGKPAMIAGQEHSVDALRLDTARVKKRAENVEQEIKQLNKLAGVVRENNSITLEQAEQYRRQLTVMSDRLAVVNENMRVVRERADAVAKVGGTGLTVGEELADFERDLNEVQDKLNGQRSALKAEVAAGKSVADDLAGTKPDKPIEDEVREQRASRMTTRQVVD
jgi:hypothetical protein